MSLTLYNLSACGHGIHFASISSYQWRGYPFSWAKALQRHIRLSASLSPHHQLLLIRAIFQWSDCSHGRIATHKNVRRHSHSVRERTAGISTWDTRGQAGGEQEQSIFRKRNLIKVVVRRRRGASYFIHDKMEQELTDTHKRFAPLKTCLWWKQLGVKLAMSSLTNNFSKECCVQA